MAKQKKNKKLKGVRYIAKVLKKYGGKKYKGNYKLALEKSKEVLQQIKSKGEKVKVSSILDKTRKHRTPKAEKKVQAPLLFYKLSSPEPYFTLVDYPTYIYNTTSEITFVSDIFNLETEEVEGSQRPNFRKTFSGFVNFLNKEINDRTKAYDYRVVCTPPEFNKELNRWESKIIPIDPEGEENDFGYEPTIGTGGEDKTLKTKQKPAPATPKKQKSDFEVAKEIDLKIEQEKSRQLAMQLFLNDKISKLEYKEMIDAINKNK